MSKSDDYRKFIAASPSDEQISSLADLVADLHLAETEVAELETRLRAAGEKARDLAETQIPECMIELNLSEFKTATGIKIELKPGLRVAPRKDDRPAVLDWLEEQGHAALIKRTVSIAFNKDQEDEATALMTFLVDKSGFPAKEERKIEPSTLKKLVADRLRAGAPLPMEILGVYQFARARITETGSEKIFDGE